MAQPHGLMADRDTFQPRDIDFSKLYAAVPTWRVCDSAEQRDLITLLDGVTIAVTNKVRFDAETIDGAPSLRLICVAATGTNNVDLEAAARRNITVCNVRGYSTPSVAQHVFSLLLALYTRLTSYDAAVRAGAWKKSDNFCLMDFPIGELCGKTLGIVGYGDIGRHVAQIGQAFGMRVIVAQRRGGPDLQGRLPLESLLREADVVSIHCPLTASTRGLIGATELALMKPNAVLVNTARGPIVDERALAEALRTGRIAGAGLDVLAHEPPRDDCPLLDLGLPNLLITPHVAWSSRESRQRLVDEVAANIAAFLEGTPRNIVVPAL